MQHARSRRLSETARLLPLVLTDLRTSFLVAGTVAALSAGPLFAASPPLWPLMVASLLIGGAGVAALWWRDVLTTTHVLAGAVALRLLYAPLLPVLSDDMYRYVWDGWIQGEGINPYRYAPNDPALAAFQDSALYEKLNSASYYSVYPPLSQLVFTLGGMLHEVDWRISYFAIKGAFLAAETMGLWLLASMVRARMLLLYAWNPVVLIEVAGQGHTEALLIPLLVGAVWAVRQRRGRLASLAVAGATLVKLYPVVLGPLLVRRFGWRAVWPGAVLAAAASAPYAAPYVIPHIHASVELYFHLFEFNAGPYYLVKEAFWRATDADWSKVIGPWFQGFFLALLPVAYGLDVWNRWSFRRSALVLLGLFFVLSTTVHPWYLLAVVPLTVLGQRPSWGWLWLALLSMGTYLFYIDGLYWPWVWLGWGGATLLRIAQMGDSWLQLVHKHRARTKVDRIAPHIHSLLAGEPRHATMEGQAETLPADNAGADREPCLQMLDLGAGEGYVGEELQQRFNARVQLADVVNLNRTDLPLTCYDGRTLPFAENEFDVTLLYFVLHHAERPERVLREALRVSKRGVVVVESVIRSDWQHRVLHALDRVANRLRSRGVMNAQEEHLSFQSAEAWIACARRLPAHVQQQERVDGILHPQLVLSMKPATSCVSDNSVIA